MLLNTFVKNLCIFSLVICGFLQIQIAFYGDAKGWFIRSIYFINQYIPGVMNPHTKAIRQWNKFFVIACLVAIFLDPLFFFVLYAEQVCFPSFYRTGLAHFFFFFCKTTD